MDKVFSKYLQETTPKVNPEVMDGLACYYMKFAEEYLDTIFRSAEIPSVKYEGYQRCTHEEEYAETTKLRNNRKSFDLARSDLYLVKYMFSFKGTPLPDRYLYLPFVEDAGVLHLGGPKFHIKPVLSDKVISPGNDVIFVRLLKDKIHFKRIPHTFVVDGKRETSNVVWSQLYRKVKDNKVPATTKAETTVAHYLFAKHGFNLTFQKYCGFTPIIGTNEINSDTIDTNQYHIVSSSQVMPKTFIVNDIYRPTELKLAIPKDKWNNLTKALVLGFFYIVDNFPSRINTTNYNSEGLYRILLGHIVFSGLYGENKLYTSVNEHFTSLDEYLDEISKEKLKERGYYVDDFYTLLALLLRDFNNLILECEDTNLSMYGKNLEILYYVFFEITSSIFKVSFKLNKLANKREVTDRDVKETFNRYFKTGKIFGLSNGKIITETVSYSGDHKYPKITSSITEQESQPGATRGRSKRLVVSQDQHIDISMVEAGSILFLSKSDPTPANHVNPFINIDLKSGTVIPNPKFDYIREKTRNTLKGRKG